MVSDSVSYTLGNGVAPVTSRKLFAQDSVTHVYYIQSEVTITDIFAPNSLAKRVVGAYAMHRKRSLAHHAAMLVTVEGGWAQNSGGLIDGADYTLTYVSKY